MIPRSRNLIAVALGLFAFENVRGQGGPPMITDDPGTPGDGKFEINLAIAFEHRPGETSFDAPGIDINYGVGDRIQLTLQGGPVLLKRNDHGATGGLGGTEAAVKWRFIDDQKTGVTMSMFPRVIFNLSQSAARRSLTEDGTRFQIPFQFAKAFPGFDLDFEWGPLVSTVGPAQWLYGIVVAVDISKTAAVMAELHGTSRTNFSDDELAVNVGIRQKLNEHCIFIGSLGHELCSPEAKALIGYAGLQFVF
ncbi:MAG TPA: hypothetical protein VH252_06145 [Chthoniobacterales bacterium]|nr:hypothetical protein [Chthoniobacterales bacterium]